MKDFVLNAIQHIDRKFNQDSSVRTLLTGIKSLDEKFGGFRKGEVTLLAASHSIGKSALALSVVKHLAVNEMIPTAYVSADLDGIQISLRLLALTSDIDLSRLRDGTLLGEDWPRLTMAANQLSEAPISILESEKLTGDNFVLSSLFSRLDKNVELLVIDYLQLSSSLIEPTDQNDPITILRELKKLAVSHNISVLVLSLLKSNTDNVPLLSDLGWNNDVERLADVIFFLQGVPYHDYTQEPSVSKLYIAKQANGPTVPVKLTFDARYSRFSDLKQTSGE